MKSSFKYLLSAVVVATVVASSSFARADILLKIVGIEGEVVDAKYPKTIALTSYDFGGTNGAIVAAGSGLGTGKVSFTGFRVRKALDKSSPKLMVAVGTGEHFSSVTLSVRKAGNPLAFVSIRLDDAMVSSYQHTSLIGGAPTEEITFTYAKITFDYSAQKPDGKLDVPVRGGFDVKLNKKMF